jgi:hypothetical protein
MTCVKALPSLRIFGNYLVIFSDYLIYRATSPINYTLNCEDPRKDLKRCQSLPQGILCPRRQNLWSPARKDCVFDV